MKMLAALVVLAALAPLAQGEEAWRWKDSKGTLCYTNRPDAAPPEATLVKTRLIVEAARLPGAPDLVIDAGQVTEARAKGPKVRKPKAPEPHRRPHRIYTEERLRFDCYASNILYSGGWAHPDDITVLGNCLPYVLGPEAWLNGARAELGLREHGIDWRDVVPAFVAQREAMRPRVTSVSDAD